MLLEHRSSNIRTEDTEEIGRVSWLRNKLLVRNTSRARPRLKLVEGTAEEHEEDEAEGGGGTDG